MTEASRVSKPTKGEKVEKAIEVAKEIAPVVAEVAIQLAPKGKKHDVRVKVGAALSILYIITDLIGHLL